LEANVPGLDDLAGMVQNGERFAIRDARPAMTSSASSTRPH